MKCWSAWMKPASIRRRKPGRRAPRSPAIHDYEYERNGDSNLVMLFAPLLGWRHGEVTDRRTKIDWAHVIRTLVDEMFPDKRVVLVMDNLDTHTPASFYEAFDSEEAG